MAKGANITYYCTTYIKTKHAEFSVIQAIQVKSYFMVDK